MSAIDTNIIDLQEGFILGIDKPLRWTSFDVVNKVRWQLCKRLGVKKLKVGHAGTLDPLATGVMVVCVGRATKRIDELQAHTKEYVATIQLGATTPSFDLEQPIDAFYPTDHITRDLILQTLPRFVGRIEQVPPAFSAVKVDGHRAYDLARTDTDVALKPKTLVIDEIELVEVSLKERTGGEATVPDGLPSGSPPAVPRSGMRRKLFLTSPAAEADPRLAHCPAITIRVVCSKGTYIRALARDIGQALGSGAHLTALRRTRVGDIAVDDCITMDALPAWLDAHGFPPLPTSTAKL